MRREFFQEKTNATWVETVVEVRHPLLGRRLAQGELQRCTKNLHFLRTKFGDEGCFLLHSLRLACEFHQQRTRFQTGDETFFGLIIGGQARDAP